MYDDLHTYQKPGSAAFAQKSHADTYDKDPDTVSMYDDLHTYQKPGSAAFAQKMDNYDHDPNTVSEYDEPHKRSTPAWILNGGVTKKPAKKSKKSKKSKSKGKGAKKSKKAKKDKDCLIHINKADTYDKDPDTVSMYDDLHTYAKPGSFAQHRDTFDKDPDTVSMYDDQHLYGPVGSWKFPKAAAAPAKAAEAKKALMQMYRQDTYDKDADTVSMYDDLHTYAKPGSFAQHRDTFDKDPDTVSMYDDQHLYGAVGSWKFPVEAKKAAAAPAKEAKKALMQMYHRDTFDKDPDTVSMYDDQHLYGAVGSWKFPVEKKEAKPAAKKAEAKKALIQMGDIPQTDNFDNDPDTVSGNDDKINLDLYRGKKVKK